MKPAPSSTAGEPPSALRKWRSIGQSDRVSPPAWAIGRCILPERTGPAAPVPPAAMRRPDHRVHVQHGAWAGATSLAGRGCNHLPAGGVYSQHLAGNVPGGTWPSGQANQKQR